MQAAFEAVVEPARRRILDLLLAGERPVGELVAELAMSQPAVSRHLRVLREAGLVAARTDAQRRLYRIMPAPLAALDSWLQPYRQMWATSLDRLAGHLDTMDDDQQEDSP
jgi:DNA-binding transcriptional ArsR family regulator